MKKAYCYIQSGPGLLKTQSLVQKQKFLNMEPRMSYLGVLGSNFEKPLSYLKSALLEFSLLQSLLQKKKSLNLEPKMPDLRYFGLEFQNTIFIFEISLLEFVLMQSLV